MNDEKGGDVVELHPAPGDYRCSDLGNARRLVRLHGRDLRWCQPLDWLVWDGARWRRDDSLEVVRLAEDTVASIRQEAAAAQDKDERAALWRHAAKSEARQALQNMLWLARADERIAVRVDDLDAQPFLFNAANGTVDLRTGKSRPADRRDLLTSVSPVPYVPDAQAPTFRRFLADVFGGDDEVVAFVLRWLGYSMTADVREQAMVVAHGTGANGKSTLLDVVAHVMGDYHRSAPPHLLVARKHESHPTERTILHGARLVTSVEIGEGRRWDTELLKQLTGGDRIVARRMRCDFFEFTPSHKLTVACNHLPRVQEADHAIWRRLLVLPFNRRFDGRDRDPKLAAKLRAEAPGILAMLVRGCRDWLEHGLRPPSAVTLATAAYRDGEDQIARWIGERCVVGANVEASAQSLFGEYRRWCEASGERAVSLTAFGKALGERGFDSARQAGSGRKIRKGIGLADQHREDAL